MKNIFLFLTATISLYLMSSADVSGQALKTKLQVTIINDAGEIIEGVEVTLYKSKEDYKSNLNEVQKGVTDKKGRVRFKELKSEVYFIDARKGDMHNDGGDVQTSPLEKGKLSKVAITIG